MTNPSANIPPEVLAAIATGGVTPVENEAPKFIFTSKAYFNEQGLRIDETIVVDGALPVGYPRFIAHVVVRITLPAEMGPNNNPLPAKQHKQPLQVPIDATDILDAFAKAPEAIQEAADGMQRQFEEQTAAKVAAEQIAKRRGKPIEEAVPETDKAVAEAKAAVAEAIQG